MTIPESSENKNSDRKNSPEMPDEQRRKLIKKIAATAIVAEVIVLADGARNVSHAS